MGRHWFCDCRLASNRYQKWRSYRYLKAAISGYAFDMGTEPVLAEIGLNRPAVKYLNPKMISSGARAMAALMIKRKEEQPDTGEKSSWCTALFVKGRHIRGKSLIWKTAAKKFITNARILNALRRSSRERHSTTSSKIRELRTSSVSATPGPQINHINIRSSLLCLYALRANTTRINSWQKNDWACKAELLRLHLRAVLWAFYYLRKRTANNAHSWG